MKERTKISYIIFIIICAIPGYLKAQFTVLMEAYPPNSYYQDVPSKVRPVEFNKLFEKIHDTEAIKLLKDCFHYNNENGLFELKDNLPPAANEELKSIFITTGYLQPEGLEVEITREVFARMGIKAEFKFYPWARCIEMMKSGSAEAIITIFKTPERETFLYYPSEYTVKVENAFFCLADCKINYDGNLEKLKNHWIAVKSSTSYGKKFDDAKYLLKRETAYTQDIIRLVENKRVEIGIGPIKGIKFFARKMGNLQKFKFLTPSICNDPLYIAFSKKKNRAKLADEFSRHLKSFKKTGKYREILSRYGI